MFRAPHEKILKELTKPATKREAKQEEAVKKTGIEEFEIDAALNEPGFAEFLAKFPDADSVDLSDDSKIAAERFVMFKEAKTVESSVTRMFVEQVESETGTRVKDEAFVDVADYLMEMAVNDRRRFQELVQTRKMFERGAEMVRKNEAEIEKLLGGISLEEREARLEDLSFAKETGFFDRLFNSSAAKKRRDILEKYNIDPKDLREAVAVETTRIKTLEKIQLIQKAILQKIKEAEATLLQTELNPLQKARAEVISTLKNELNAISVTPGPDQVSKLENVGRKINKMDSSRSSLSLHSDELADLRVELDKATDKILSAHLADAVSKSESKVISNMESKIAEILSRMTSQGIKTPENMRKIIAKLRDLTSTEKDLAKRLFIKRIAIRYSNI